MSKSALVRSLLVLLSCLPALRAQAEAGPRIGTRVSPPFVIEVDPATGEASGLAIDLFREVAARVEELQGTPRYSTHEVQELIDRTAAGEFDLAVAALTVTGPREERIDFSREFLTSGIGIAVSDASEPGFGAVLAQVFSWRMLRAVGALVLVLLVFGVLMWICERRRNAEQFGGGGARGVGEGFWWSAVTMTTVGYGDRAPVTAMGRAVALVWMFTSIIIISSYTASIASALTVSGLQSAVRGKEDLPHVRVVSIEGTSSGDWLDAAGIAYRRVTSVEAALGELAKGRADAVVYDQPILRYLAREQHPGEIEVLPTVLREDRYAFAMSEDSPLRESVNRALASVLESDSWQALRQRYLGSD